MSLVQNGDNTVRLWYRIHGSILWRMKPYDMIYYVLSLYDIQLYSIEGLYGLHGPRCPLSEKGIKFNHSLIHSKGWFLGQLWVFSVVNLALVGFPLTSAVGENLHVPPGQNGRHLADDIFRCIFMNEKFCTLIKLSLKFVPKGPIDNYPVFRLDNGLAPNMRQAIIWTNAGPVHWRICAA